MIYEVRVKAGAKGDLGVKRDGDSLMVRVSARAHDGEANAAVIEAIADFFGVAKGRVRIISGTKSKLKRVEIL